MENTSNLTDTLTAIAFADAEDLFKIASAVKRRQAQLQSTFQPGDVIALAHCSPKYLVGAEATVVGKSGKKVVIRFDRPGTDPRALARFGTRDVTIDASAIRSA